MYEIRPRIPSGTTDKTLMKADQLLKRALELDFLSIEEGMFLYSNVPTAELMYVGNELRNHHKKNSKKVTWQIDRNANTTNVCIANCKFCNFYRIPGHAESYITDERLKKPLSMAVISCCCRADIILTLD